MQTKYDKNQKNKILASFFYNQVDRFYIMPKEEDKEDPKSNDIYLVVRSLKKSDG